MALLHRRKSFSVISRYRLCGRYYFSSLSSGSASSTAAITGFSPPSPSSTQIQSLRQLFPQRAVVFQSSLVQSPRSYTVVATCLGSKHTTPRCHSHKCASDCGCPCTFTGALRSLGRNCTTTAYPPPASPGEYQGGAGEAEADGAPLNVDEAEGEAPIGAEGFNMPPYDDSNYPEEEDYEDEDPPPDPEEKLLFSPSDED